MTRSILTPRLDDEFARAGAKSYWKRVLPIRAINYVDKAGKARVIDFDERYLADVKASFEAGALDDSKSAPFVLADKDNAHTMDPERFRGEVTAMARESELPDDIKAAIVASEGRLTPGLYSRIDFASKKAAKAVVLNPKLPVSMRIRENVERSDGQKFPAVAIHVLGTMDPKIPGLGAWLPATADLSEYAADDIVDLSDKTYRETTVGKQKKTKDVQLGGGTATIEVPKIEDVDADDIAKWTDEQLTAFLEQYAPGEGDGDDSGDGDGDDDSGDGDGDGDDSDDDSPEATLSNTANADIQFANEQAANAQRQAREALNRAAQIEWSATRSGLIREGVPPHVLDLAEPVLSRANDTVLDLSNFDEDDLNVTEIVRELVAGYKGTIDLSVAAGHGGNDDSDPEKAVRERFDAETAGL